MRKILPFDKEDVGETGLESYTFDCPGCKQTHVIYTKGHPQINWDFNNSLESPTFTPSLLVWNDRATPPWRCHSFIKEGKIQFLSDCTHDLAGQTVDMEEFE